MDFEISMGFMGFLWISGFLWDFNLWLSRFLWDLWDFYGIISVFYGNNRYFTEIIGINILLGISDLGFKQDFSSDFSICVQDFSLLRTPWFEDTLIASIIYHYVATMLASYVLQNTLCTTFIRIKDKKCIV